MYFSEKLGVDALLHFGLDGSEFFEKRGDLGFVLCFEMWEEIMGVGLSVEAFVICVKNLCVLVLFR